MDEKEWQQCIGALNAFYQALNDRDFTTAHMHLSERDKKFLSLEQFEANREDDTLPASWTLSPSRTQTRIIVQEEERESYDVAYILVVIKFEPDQKNFLFEQEMIKEDDDWRVYQRSDLRNARIEITLKHSTETWRIWRIKRATIGNQNS